MVGIRFNSGWEDSTDVSDEQVGKLYPYKHSSQKLVDR